MSHTLETAIAFPIVLAGIVFLISSGPVLYQEASETAAFKASAIQLSAECRSIYIKKTLIYEDHSYDIISVSPERMHFFVRAVEDSGKILTEGVTSP